MMALIFQIRAILPVLTEGFITIFMRMMKVNIQFTKKN